LDDSLTPELAALTLAGLLQATQYVLMAVPANIDLGTDWTLSSRDHPPSQSLSPTSARLKRALDNHFEGLILFTLAVVAVTLSGKASTFTALCAWTYLSARVLYVPAYAFDLTPWRSLIWAVGFFATALMLIAVLL
jgi:uncharacterized MAPEG superfamily protein